MPGAARGRLVTARHVQGRLAGRTPHPCLPRSGPVHEQRVVDPRRRPGARRPYWTTIERQDRRKAGDGKDRLWPFSFPSRPPCLVVRCLPPRSGSGGTAASFIRAAKYPRRAFRFVFAGSLGTNRRAPRSAPAFVTVGRHPEEGRRLNRPSMERPPRTGVRTVLSSS